MFHLSSLLQLQSFEKNCFTDEYNETSVCLLTTTWKMKYVYKVIVIKSSLLLLSRGRAMSWCLEHHAFKLDNVVSPYIAPVHLVVRVIIWL